MPLMNETHSDDEARDPTNEMQDRSWYPVYASVIVFTVFVILALWAFSRHFTS